MGTSDLEKKLDELFVAAVTATNSGRGMESKRWDLDAARPDVLRA
jgi:hypothetical protein